METGHKHVTTGYAALHIGCGLMPHHVGRLCARGLVPFEQVGRLRLIRVADLPAVRAAAVEAGFIREEATANA